MLASVGTLLLIGFVSKNGLSILITPLGLIAGLLAATAAAYYSVASKKIVMDKGAWWLLTWGFIIGGILTSPFGIVTLFRYNVPVSPEIQSIAIWALVAFVVIFGTMLSFGLYLSGLRHLPATEIGVVASFEPIAASVAAYVFLGNVLQPVQYLGGGIILLSVILIAAKPTSVRDEEKRAAPGQEKKEGSDDIQN
jgi:drug/metabolite transporter (DMT)-like permease